MIIISPSSAITSTSPRRAARHRPSMSRLPLLLLGLLLIATVWSPSCLFVDANGLKNNAYVTPTEDPYTVLGVKEKDHNNLDAIKKAYREKAKVAHPDKNLDHKDQNFVNEKFHRIQNAWEFLSNEKHKHKYDNMKRNGGWQTPNQSQQNQPHRHQNRSPTAHTRGVHERAKKEWAKQQEKQRQQQEKKRKEQEQSARRLKEERELAKEAQEHVLQFSTLEQLIDADIIDETTQRFKKHFLCVFVSNKDIERTAETEYLFPYPFGPSGRNGFDWRDTIQTAKVRFNKATPLTKAFKVPKHLSKPHIVFVPKGTLFGSHKFAKVYPGTGHVFQIWILMQLETKVTVFNRNSEGGPPIKIFFYDTIKKRLSSACVTIQPGHQLEIIARISDRLIALDATTDEFMGSNGISKDKIISDVTEDTVDRIALDDFMVKEEGQIINIGTGYGTTRTCYDLSVKCYIWIQLGAPNACQNLSSFAHAMCAKTCGVCIESPYFNGLYYAMFHTPSHKVPRELRNVIPALREVAEFIGMVCHDFTHIWKLRRNVMFGFLAGGILAGIQIILLFKMLRPGRRVAAGFTGQHQQQYKRTTTAVNDTSNSPSLVIFAFLISSTGFVTSVWIWLSHAQANDIPSQLKDFCKDLREVQRFSKDIFSYLFCLGAGSLVLCKALAYRLFRRRDLRLFHHALFLASTVLVTVAMVVGLTLHLRKEQTRGIEHSYRYYRWNAIWEIRKNVVVAIIGVGHLFGATVVAGATMAKHRYGSSVWRHLSLTYIFASLANFGVGCGLVSLALVMDKFFLDDLEHVVSMRMSAAIPCSLVGMLLGVSVAHLCIRTTAKLRYHRGTMKSKID